MRTLYLTRSLSMNGRSSFVGRHLYDAFEAASDEILLGHYVLDEASEEVSLPPELEPDAIRLSTFRHFDPTLIYFEGGLGRVLLDDGFRWRVPRGVLEEYVRRGSTAIVADVDCNIAERDRDIYEGATDFLRASIDFGDGSGVVYAADTESHWRSDRTIVVRPDLMSVSRWLEPVYEGVEEIVVGVPAVLNDFESVLATGNRDSTGTLQHDMWVERIHAAPFASVRTLGLGHVVLIAANVSHDNWTERTDGNLKWLVNCARFLEGQASADAGRRAPLQELQATVVAARAASAVLAGDEAGDELARRTTAAVENEAKRVTKSSAAREVRDGLERAFSPQLWANFPREAQDFLTTAEVLRAELEDYRSVDPGFDFSASVLTYSKAVETAIIEMIFAPYREASRLHDLPSTGDRKQRKSIELLQRYVGGANIGLGAMARCLANVGCGLRTVTGNGFAAFLEGNAADFEEFCGGGFPARLIDYVDRFRNGAAHVSTMSLADCVGARQYLLEEPSKLLLELATQFPSR